VEQHTIDRRVSIAAGSDHALRVFDAVQEAAEDDHYSAKVDSTLKLLRATRADGRAALERCRRLAEHGDELSSRAASLLEGLLRMDEFWAD
jgi:hypothetical protein